MLARLAAVALVLAATPLAVSASAPTLDALVGRISMSLGGPNGGAKIVDGAPAIELVFRRTLKDSHSRDEITADHRYVESGERRRLDVRVIEGDGKDSAAVIGDGSWLIVDGAVHEVEPSAVSAQLGEFDPRRLWSVPFALASEGREILQAASLEVEGRHETDAGFAYLLLVGRNEEGEETSRVEVDAETYHPTKVQFLSSSGQVEYRYGDYRRVADGLLVPFVREFHRNGTRISRTEVTRFKLVAPKDEAKLFDRAVTKLAPLPAPKGATSPE